jgi:hypothetical protein
VVLLPGRFFHKPRYVPRVMVTGKPRSYGAAHREVFPSVTHRQSHPALRDALVTLDTKQLDSARLHLPGVRATGPGARRLGAGHLSRAICHSGSVLILRGTHLKPVTLAREPAMILVCSFVSGTATLVNVGLLLSHRRTPEHVST